MGSQRPDQKKEEERRTLGKWDTANVDLEVKPGSKPFNDGYYPVHKINNNTLCRELQCLVEIGVLSLS